jgi:hypothetical protein
MLINDFQGVCSLPEPVDDDFITSQGMFPQPASRVSVLAGFVAIAREFQIISEWLVEGFADCDTRSNDESD